VESFVLPFLALAVAAGGLASACLGYRLHVERKQSRDAAAAAAGYSTFVSRISGMVASSTSIRPY